VGLQSTILKIKRAETPFYRWLKGLYKTAMTASMPVPRALKPLGSACYELVFVIRMFFERLLTFFFREPMFRSRCESAGKRLSIGLLPRIYGHTTIRIGDDVRFNGQTAIFSGRSLDQPVLAIGNRVSFGHQTSISCNRSITVEDDVYIASSCSIADNDGHPLDPHLRAAGLPAPPETTRSVLIRRNAWIGNSCHILKGVTIGRGAIIGSGSVVTSDIPDFAIAGGNPARVIRLLRADEGAEAATPVASAGTSSQG
jgi:acetyltransferase-like isoleucine patch superfamily enzyme